MGWSSGFNKSTTRSNSCLPKLCNYDYGSCLHDATCCRDPKHARMSNPNVQSIASTPPPPRFGSALNSTANLSGNIRRWERRWQRDPGCCNFICSKMIPTMGSNGFAALAWRSICLAGNLHQKHSLLIMRSCIYLEPRSQMLPATSTFPCFWPPWSTHRPSVSARSFGGCGSKWRLGGKPMLRDVGIRGPSAAKVQNSGFVGKQQELTSHTSSAQKGRKQTPCNCNIAAASGRRILRQHAATRGSLVGLLA